jgi:hypothetical protein
VAVALGRSAEARGHICKALRILVDKGGLQNDVEVLEVLPSIAQFLADRGEVERAVELYALASRYPHVAHARCWEDTAGRHIAAAAKALPPEVIEAAQARGRARDLEATVRELLAEFEAPDGSSETRQG